MRSLASFAGRTLLLIIATGMFCADLTAQDTKAHYVCIAGDGTYHDRTQCALLQMCTGGKYRKTTDVGKLKPCRKCARPVSMPGDFHDIKRVLGVKDRKQIADSLGTAESVIKRDGYTLRILGAPGSKTVNTLEFFPADPITYTEDAFLSSSFFEKLNLRFEGCQADTIRNLTPHPVSGKTDKTVTIEYRNCAIVEPRDAYDDVRKYFYRLAFIPGETDRGAVLEKVVLTLEVVR